MVRLANQSHKRVAVTVPLVAHQSPPFHSKETAARSPCNLKGHPVAMLAPPITQRVVVIALQFGLRSHQQTLHVNVVRTKMGQQGHPAVTAALDVIAVATARRLP